MQDELLQEDGEITSARLGTALGIVKVFLKSIQRIET